MIKVKELKALPLKRLTSNLLEATRLAAIAASGLIGKNQKDEADQLAVTAMRGSLNKTAFSGRIVIGEGERDEAPMLAIGEKIGSLKEDYQPYIDIAVDPLEGTELTAKGKKGAMSVLAASINGGLFHAPDLYMHKIAIGIKADKKDISLANSTRQNIKNLARLKHKKPEELLIIALDRPRHAELINEVKSSGAKLQLISDGDIAAAIATTTNEADMYIGSGGAPEGVLAASALKVAGGTFCGKLITRNNDEMQRLKKCGINDVDKIYFTNDLVPGEVIFVATGVTDGPLFAGVKKSGSCYKTQSLIMQSWDGQISRRSNIITEGEYNLNKSGHL